MNPQGLADELNDLLATETRSLARHLDEATPYLTPATYQAWNRIKHFGSLSAEHAERLSAIQAALNLPSSPRPYPVDVANYHYLKLDFLVPKLIEEKERQIAAYERALQHVAGEPDIQAELEELLAQNREQLASLRSLLTSEAAASA